MQKSAKSIALSRLFANFAARNSFSMPMVVPKKKTNKDTNKCITCKHASFKQWFDNPVIALCEVAHGERFVAEIRRVCPNYEETDKEPVIEHHDHYDIK
jgi:hypothetical protein